MFRKKLPIALSPTIDQVVSRTKEIWDRVRKEFPDAPPEVQDQILSILLMYTRDGLVVLTKTLPAYPAGEADPDPAQ